MAEEGTVAGEGYTARVEHEGEGFPAMAEEKGHAGVGASTPHSAFKNSIRVNLHTQYLAQN